MQFCPHKCLAPGLTLLDGFNPVDVKIVILDIGHKPVGSVLKAGGFDPAVLNTGILHAKEAADAVPPSRRGPRKSNTRNAE